MSNEKLSNEADNPALNKGAVNNRLPLDVEADQLKGMIESMTGVDSKMVEILKKRLAIVELELSLNGC
jgi:hypothetical protein